MTRHCDVTLATVALWTTGQKEDHLLPDYSCHGVLKPWKAKTTDKGDYCNISSILPE